MKKRRLISMVLAMLILIGSVSTVAFAAEEEPEVIRVWTNDVKVTKISNPDRGEREVDGLIEGGDRENSYTWRLAMRGDEIFIATTRNIASALVNMYGSEFVKAGISLDAFWGLINVVANGDIPRNDANEGANIVRYNRTTGEFDVVYTADKGDYFRMAVTFGDDVYFGSYSAVPTNPQYILKLDTEGNFTKVFQTMGSVSLRANCVYDDHLFFAGADDRTPLAEGETAPVAKMAVLRKSNEDDTVWERVADFRDFGTTSYDPIHESWAGAPIWELANHDGYIYATAPTHSGFVIYKGRPAEDGEDANEYGWVWTEVAGPTNGINNPGLSEVEGGEPGTMRSLIGSVYEFNGELYAYNFDHSFGGEAAAFAGLVQQLTGQDVKASDYLFYLYNSLQSPQRVWKLDDETGKFEECKEFTKLVEDTTNEYIWRMGEHNGKLYIATMDAGIFYNYLTQLTNGSILNMSKEERLQQIGYIGELIKILAEPAVNEAMASLKDLLEQIKTALEEFQPEEELDEETAEEMQRLMAMMDELDAKMDQLFEELMNMDTDELINYILSMFEETDGEELAPTGASADIAESALSLLPIQFLKETAEKIKTAVKNGWDLVVNGLVEQVKAAVANVVNKVKETVDAINAKIDWQGIEMYLEINETVKNNIWGFDMFRTEDGETFDIITLNGFGDKYNYGCSAFLSTEEGLYIGTCNPFYGGQLYLLTENEPDEKDYVIGDADGDGYVTIFDATMIQRYLADMAPENFDEVAADYDGDGEVTIFDATAIQRHLAGMD